MFMCVRSDGGFFVQTQNIWLVKLKRKLSCPLFYTFVANVRRRHQAPFPKDQTAPPMCLVACVGDVSFLRIKRTSFQARSEQVADKVLQ